jgi:hypothetical protein
MGAEGADLAELATSARAAISAAKQGLTKASDNHIVAIIFMRVMDQNSSRLKISLTEQSMHEQSIALLATVKA